MENFTNFTNSEIINGPFLLVFDEPCPVPEQKAWMDSSEIRLYFDPEGTDFGQIICSTRVRKTSLRRCKLVFPSYPGWPILKKGELGDWQTFRLTDYTEIFQKLWKKWNCQTGRLE